MYRMSTLNNFLFDTGELKVKLSLCHEGVLGSEGIAPRILDLGTRWR